MYKRSAYESRQLNQNFPISENSFNYYSELTRKVVSCYYYFTLTEENKNFRRISRRNLSEIVGKTLAQPSSRRLIS